MRALERRGCVRYGADTPAELGRRAAEKNDPGAAAYARLVKLYYEARYGAMHVDERLLESLSSDVVSPQRRALSPSSRAPGGRTN